MARRAYYKNWGVPASVVMVVTSVCADYTRRDKALRSCSMNEAVQEHLRSLNAIVDTALEDIEPAIRKDIINDITYGRGYNKSACSLILAKDTYYRRRRKLIYDIAIAMRLI
jgi:hypothetical protein